jgi:hypothetical protein
VQHTALPDGGVFFSAKKNLEEARKKWSLEETKKVAKMAKKWHNSGKKVAEKIDLKLFRTKKTYKICIFHNFFFNYRDKKPLIIRNWHRKVVLQMFFTHQLLYCQIFFYCLHFLSRNGRKTRKATLATLYKIVFFS